MKAASYSVGPFEVSYDGVSVVTLWGTASSPEHFDNLLNQGHTARLHFRQTKPGSDWGCDGVGYMVQKCLLRVQICRSGVGPVSFREGLSSLQRAIGKAA